MREHIPTLPYEKRLSKVDTLKLAIGYINFLSETLTTGRSPGDAAARAPVVQPRKVFLRPSAQAAALTDDPSGGSQVIGHSLSCRHDHALPLKGERLLTKLWTPEDPRRQKTSENAGSACSVGSSSSSSDLVSSSPEPTSLPPPLAHQAFPSAARDSRSSRCSRHPDILAACCHALTDSP